MGEIFTVIYRKEDLTVNTAMGEILIKDIITAAKSYLMNSPTRKVLWNFIRADGSRILSDEFNQLYTSLKMIVDPSYNPKIAVVVSGDFGYGLSRLSKSYAEISGMDFDYYISRSLEDAMEWLG